MSHPTLCTSRSAVAQLALLCCTVIASACRPAASADANRARTDRAPQPAPQTDVAPPRLVTIGGAITETVFALGLGPAVVGVDTSSVFPVQATRLPQVGYQRTLSAEGVLALRPTRVLAAEEAGPPHALTQLRSAGIAVEIIAAPHSIAGAREKIRTLARLLDVPAHGAQLIRQLDDDLAHAPAPAHRPRVLALYARSTTTLLVAGHDTPFDAMLQLAGAENAAATLRGFRPYSAEALVAARPDALLLTDRGAASLGGPSGLRTLPGLATSESAPSPALVTLDDLLLLGFGPRTGQAIAALRRKLAALPVARTPTTTAATHTVAEARP